MSCAVFILCSLPCFFFCTLMKSPQKTQNVGFLDCFLPPYCKKKYLYNTIDVYATSQPDLVSQMKASDPVLDHCSISARIQHNERHPRHAQRNPKLSYLIFSVNWAELRQAIENASLLEKVQCIDRFGQVRTGVKRYFSSTVSPNLANPQTCVQFSNRVSLEKLRPSEVVEAALRHASIGVRRELV